MASTGPVDGPGFWTVAIGGMMSLIGTITGYLTVRLHNRVDALEKQSAEDGKVNVTRGELQTYIHAATADRREMHAQNYALLERIYASVSDHSQLREKVLRGERDIDSLGDKHDSDVRALREAIQDLASRIQ